MNPIRTITKPAAIILAFTMLLSMATPLMTPAMEKAARLQPYLAEMAARSPGEMVRVIVQKTDDTDRAERFAERLGAEIYAKLDIINGFAAELKAELTPNLAAHASVQWVSWDAPMVSTGALKTPGTNTTNTYLETLGVPQVWNMNYKGRGLTVAVIDSGVTNEEDFSGPSSYFWSRNDRMLAHVSGVEGQEGFGLDSDRSRCNDRNQLGCWFTRDNYGHGTHVAGIIGGNGASSNGLYLGIAPEVNLVNGRVADLNGMATESAVVNILQIVLENKDLLGIRVVNISLNSTMEQSYHTNPVDAACEMLWFSGIVVVVSAGNSGGLGYNTINAAPANDPYVITVGATDEMLTSDRSDDTILTSSAFGTTMDGYVKPDIYAPGRHIISVLSSDSPWDTEHPDRVLMDGQYFRVSGTSMAAPMVAGAAALLLDLDASLTPDQVKYVLMHTGTDISSNGQSGKYLDVLAATNYVDNAADIPAANQGLEPHLLIRKVVVVVVGYVANEECEPLSGCDLSTIDWASIDWASMDWASMDWASIDWANIDWASMDWASIDWASMDWASMDWASMDWASIDWASMDWASMDWASMDWASMDWASMDWASMDWASMDWASVDWNSMDFDN